MAFFRDFLGLVRAARQHVVSNNHLLGRFDDDRQMLKGYHCVTCGQIWMISQYDIMSSAIRQQNILACAEVPDGFDILLGILNAEPEDMYLYNENGRPPELGPQSEPQPRYDRDEPL